MALVDPMMLETFKTMVSAPGVGHMALGVGITLASATLNHKLRQMKADTAIFIVDKFVYVSGGLILMDLLFRALGTAYRMFSTF